MKYHRFTNFSLIPLLVISLNSQAQNSETFKTENVRLPTIDRITGYPEDVACSQPDEFYDGGKFTGQMSLGLTGNLLSIDKWNIETPGIFDSPDSWSGDSKVVTLADSDSLFLVFNFTKKTELTGFLDEETFKGIYLNSRQPAFSATFTSRRMEEELYWDSTDQMLKTKVFDCTFRKTIKGGEGLIGISEGAIIPDFYSTVRKIIVDNFVDLFKDELKSNTTRKTKHIALGVRG